MPLPLLEAHVEEMGPLEARDSLRLWSIAAAGRQMGLQDAKALLAGWRRLAHVAEQVRRADLTTKAGAAAFARGLGLPIKRAAPKAVTNAP